MRHLILALPAGVVLLGLAACTQTPAPIAAQPVPVAAVQDVQTALNAYQNALGVAQVALAGNPALLAKVNVQYKTYGA